MRKAMPRLAVIAISLIAGISINKIVIKPMQSLSNAIKPGTSSVEWLLIIAVSFILLLSVSILILSNCNCFFTD